MDHVLCAVWHLNPRDYCFEFESLAMLSHRPDFSTTCRYFLPPDPDLGWRRSPSMILTSQQVKQSISSAHLMMKHNLKLMGLWGWWRPSPKLQAPNPKAWRGPASTKCSLAQGSRRRSGHVSWRKYLAPRARWGKSISIRSASSFSCSHRSSSSFAVRTDTSLRCRVLKKFSVLFSSECG